MYLLKLFAIAFLTLTVVVATPYLTSRVSFSPSTLSAQIHPERKAEEADQLLKQGIENLQLQSQMDADKIDSTLNIFKKALSLYQEIDDRNGEGQVLKNLGSFYYKLENYPQALDYTQQCLKIAQEIEDLDLQARAYNNQGLIYSTQNNYQTAIDSFKNGLSIIKKITNPEVELRLNYNLANTYKQSKKISDAVNYYEKALVTAKQLKHLYPQYDILNNLAEIYQNRGDNNRANNYYQQALEVAKQIDANKISSLPKQEIKGIKVPSVFDISLQGKVDGESFKNLSATLEIRPTTGEDDSNPFLIALYIAQTSPADTKVGNLFWQSFTANHPQRQQHYSRISVQNDRVTMKINPSEGLRNDITWFTSENSFTDELRKINEEIEKINEQIDRINEERGQPKIEIDSNPIPDQPFPTGVVGNNGTVTFSIQGNQVSGTINASGITDSGKKSTYQAKFKGQIRQQQANNDRTYNSLNNQNINPNQNQEKSLFSFLSDSDFQKKK